MSGNPNVNRKARRRQETSDEIVAAAWDQVRERGLAGLSMRDLGDRVGMRAQSLYSYFASKHEIYDAMFLQGNEAFLEWMQERPDPGTGAGDRVADVRRAAHRIIEFCVNDPVRYQLLFQRTIPDFVPSERSYAVAQAAYQLTVDWLAAVDVDQSGVDLWTAMLAGLVAQQLSNDPGGDRWSVLVDRAVDMLLTELVPSPRKPSPRKKATTRRSR
jgi:AcrR family transcriptional regulator